MSTLQFKVRLGEDLHAAIKQAAEQSNRSVNAEIVHRLEMSFINNQRLANTSLVKASDAIVLSELARQQLPTTILEVVIAGINHAISLGHSSAWVDIYDFQLDDLDQDEYDAVMEPVKQVLEEAGYSIASVCADAMEINFSPATPSQDLQP